MNTVHNRRVSGVLHHHCGAWCCPFPHHTHGMDGMGWWWLVDEGVGVDG